MRDLIVWELICRGGLNKLITAYKGYEEQISIMVAKKQNEGIMVKREGKVKKLEMREKFLRKVVKYKKVDKYKMSILQSLILNPWRDVAKILIKYITL